MDWMAELLRVARDAHVSVIEMEIAPMTAAYMRMDGDAVLLLRRGLDAREALCACAEGLGHHFMGTQNLLRMPPEAARRAQQLARGWAYVRLAPLDRLAEALFLCGGDLPAAAEHLGVTLLFLEDSIAFYRGQHGEGRRAGRYWVAFSPELAVKEMAAR